MRVLILFAFLATVTLEQTCYTNTVDSDQQVIVRFREYRPGNQWRADIEQALSHLSPRWSWVERNNPANKFPTDFGVLKLHGMEIADLEEALRGQNLVKDVNLDRVINREALMHNKEDSLKPPGRFQTRPTFGLNSEDDGYIYQEDVEEAFTEDRGLRRALLLGRKYKSVASALNAQDIWVLGYTGQNVRVGVFDTGIKADHPHVRKIVERTNWTDQNTKSDGLGHGSFVAGVIAGHDEACKGLAPDVELYTYKVFTDDQVSYTSWFLDAFNYAMMRRMHIVNLSIGGPDYLDKPFVEKVLEVTASGIIMLSAIGNDGPLFGSLNNPADQNDVIGIGGIDYKDALARFSSRGMSTWELPLGYGRIKPDVVAYAQDVSGSKIVDGCRSLSGTSVASPVAAGAVALLASTVPEDERWEVLNPGSMKQALVEGATRLPQYSVFLQGAGKINLEESMKLLQGYKPRASLIPSPIDLTDHPYMWPFSIQPLYASSMPVIFNATVINGIAVAGNIVDPVFVPFDEGGRLLEVEFEYSDVLWPWSGFLALYIHVTQEGREFDGVANGEIRFAVQSGSVVSNVTVPFKANIVPTPPRAQRILWDQFHSVKYPPGYFPRDNLDIHQDILDWNGDHIHTNFYKMYDFLRERGYYVEVLGSPFTCFDASQYGALMIVDSEDVFYPEEIAKLKKDVAQNGLGLIVFAEWFNENTAKNYVFFDDNTRSWWTPATGGGNIPGLNELLAGFGIAFGDAVLKGSQAITSKMSVYYSSGSNIVRFPEGGFLHGHELEDTSKDGNIKDKYYTMGLTDMGRGRVAVYGDSNCLDSSYQSSDCNELLKAMLDYVNRVDGNQVLESLISSERRVSTALGVGDSELPRPITGINFSDYSFVLRHPLQCYKNCAKTTAGGAKEETYAAKEFEEADSGDQALRPPQKQAQPDRVVQTQTTQNSLDNQKFFASSGISDWTPLLFLSKWSAILGVAIMIGLYKFNRRRRRQPASRIVSAVS